MPDDAGEFEDDADFAEGYCAPLPPEDRLWRHPSEVNQQPAADLFGAAHGRRHERRGGPPAYERAVLTAAPARAGSWSAGLAGALLATGLVLVGTHLAASMRQRGTSKAPAADLTASTTALIAAGVHSAKLGAEESALAPAQASWVGRQLGKVADRVYEATVMVQATQGSRTERFAGLVVGSDCLVVAPANLVTVSETIDLTLAGGQVVAARVLGIDDQAGIAVLRCEVQHMTTVPDTSEDATARQMVALVDEAPHAVGLAVGLVMASDQRIYLETGAPLLDAMSTDIPSTTEGTGLIDGDGDVVGVVVGAVGGTAVAAPTWLAVSVARQLAGAREPAHAWLGIDGASLLADGQPAGVQVQAVAPGSAAARAGLRAGDVIKGVDGLGTSSLVALQARLYCLSPGTPAEIDLQRGSRSLVARTTLDRAPAA